jgi:hypothetical protein
MHETVFVQLFERLNSGTNSPGFFAKCRPSLNESQTPPARLETETAATGALQRSYHPRLSCARDSARSPAFRFPDGSHIFPFAALLESECHNFRYLVYVALSFHPASVVKGKSREHISEYRYAKYDGGATYLISINFDFAAIGTQAVQVSRLISFSPQRPKSDVPVEVFRNLSS